MEVPQTISADSPAYGALLRMCVTYAAPTEDMYSRPEPPCSWIAKNGLVSQKK